MGTLAFSVMLSGEREKGKQGYLFLLLFFDKSRINIRDLKA